MLKHSKKEETKICISPKNKQNNNGYSSDNWNYSQSFYLINSIFENDPKNTSVLLPHPVNQENKVVPEWTNSWNKNWMRQLSFPCYYLVGY